MHSPLPQLLCALRTSIFNSSINARSSVSRFPSYISQCAVLTSSLPSSRRNQSSTIRPERMVSRSQPHKPISRDRGPQSGENTQTDFASLDVFNNVPVPSTAIDATLDSGFHLNSGVRIKNGDGLLLVGGEAFAWRPWKTVKGADNDDAAKSGMINAKGQFELDKEAWGLLSLVWPRPDLLIIGLGNSMFPLAPETKRHINSLGIRVEIQDTRNAAAQFNLLATERGVNDIAAAMVPIGWKGK